MGESDERRVADRLELQLPIQGRVGKGEFFDLEVVDISLGGMQLKSSDFDSIKLGFDKDKNVANFEIRISGRLAWAQPGDDGTFLTGWEFDVGPSGEEMVG
jgi:hypothetical protein